jgi:hypothetical protein
MPTVAIAMTLLRTEVLSSCRPNVLIEKTLYPIPKINTRLDQPPTMTFFRILDPLHIRVVGFDGFIKPGSMNHRHTPIRSAVSQQQRLRNPGRLQDG